MIDIDVSLFLQIILTLALIFVLNKILYKPIRRFLEERESRMGAIRSEAEKFERNAQQLLENYEQKLAEARRKGQAQREALKEEARQLEAKLLEESTKEASARKQELMAELTAQIEAAKKDLLSKAEAFGLEIAQKILGRAL